MSMTTLEKARLKEVQDNLERLLSSHERKVLESLREAYDQLPSYAEIQHQLATGKSK